MKRAKINVLIVTMLLLCAALSIGCVDDTAKTTEPTERLQVEVSNNNSSTQHAISTDLGPAKLVIKSIKAEDEGIVFKIKNEGESPAEGMYFAMIGIDYNPRFDENLKWHHNISDSECNELINGAIRSNDFELNTYDSGRSIQKRVQNPNNPHDYIKVNVSGEPLHLMPVVYRDYLEGIEPDEIVESNFYVYWDHDRYIKVIYDEDYNIYEYKLYDQSDFRKLKGIIY
jgi:hypothetical protein